MLTDRLAQLLESEDPQRLDSAREVLACGALEGRAFTAAAVASALTRSTDEIIDLLDDYLAINEKRLNGLVREGVSVRVIGPGGQSRTLWRYEFASELVQQAFERSLTTDETKRLSEALAQSLISLYGDEQYSVARAIARLFRRADNTADAAEFQRIADFYGQLDALVEQARVLQSLNWDDLDYWERSRALSELCVALGPMLYARPLEETLSIGESACQLADLFGDRAGSRGYFAYKQTAECLSILGRHEESLAHSQRALEFARSTGSNRLISDAFHHLGLVHYGRKELDDAREAFRHAIGTHPGPITLVQLAFTETRLGELDAALASANKALAMSRRIGDQRAESGALMALGVIHRERGELELALSKLEASLEIERDPYHRAESLLELGEVELELGHDDRARECAFRAIAINEKLGVKGIEKDLDRLVTSIDERGSP